MDRCGSCLTLMCSKNYLSVSLVSVILILTGTQGFWVSSGSLFQGTGYESRIEGELGATMYGGIENSFLQSFARRRSEPDMGGFQRCRDMEVSEREMFLNS